MLNIIPIEHKIHNVQPVISIDNGDAKSIIYLCNRLLVLAGTDDCFSTAVRPPSMDIEPNRVIPYHCWLVNVIFGSRQKAGRLSDRRRRRRQRGEGYEHGSGGIFSSIGVAWPLPPQFGIVPDTKSRWISLYEVVSVDLGGGSEIGSLAFLASQLQ